jgi:hypothetical protein
MPHNRPISFPLLIYLPRIKTAPDPVSDRNAVPARSPLTLTIFQPSPPCTTLSAKQPGQRTHEYEPNRGNMLGFNNFFMANVIELGSKSQESQLSPLSPLSQKSP